ncbi:MAG: aminomethyl-transferring glycine dehydrogenase subunit GcvPB [Desulfurococcales archaeon]|nr:aminomethyl-transferring glycine dehydrogenase subunit GcvPB [Desulfurococcales archaeon]
MYRQARWDEPLLYEIGDAGRTGFIPPEPGEDVKGYVGELKIPESVARRGPPPIPGVSEVELVRHYTRLAEMSYGVDSGPVPLGSCTMKYNPRIALRYSYHPKLEHLHPLLDDSAVQGILEIMYRMQEWLKAILGMDYCTLHPAAGAHGELAGVLVMRRYHKAKGQLDTKREVIVPDSAHGTNPASAAMAGFTVVEVPTGSDGNIDMEALRAAVGRETAGFMITNPSTLGLFEENILEIAELIHGVDGLLYYDGANLNGILGHARPGDMGFDIAHVNLHKTFSAPHGGGGPGAGPVCIRDKSIGDGISLKDLVPGPVVVYRGGEYRLEWPRLGGAIRAWQANTSVVVWAYIYILSMGAKGLRMAGEVSVVNTNYFISRLKEASRYYEIPYGGGRHRKHEVVVSAKPLKAVTGVTAEDIAKFLLDTGLYAPTIYFPLIVDEALMFEFTESETRENIDRYVEALKRAAELAMEDPERLKSMPRNTSSLRVNLVEANHPKTVTPSWRVYIRRRRGEIGPLR